MEFTYFEIENFRGVQKAYIDLQGAPKSRIFPLVGLNESGKTTILEAINHFSYKLETLDPLKLPGYSIKDSHSLIPIAARSNFNGTVRCKYGLKLNGEDKQLIIDFLIKEKKFTEAEVGDAIDVEHHLVFKDSKASKEESKITWTWPKKGKKTGKRKAVSISGEDWNELAKFTKKLIPSILYFPTFLFDFPEKIFLEDGDAAEEKNKFFRAVLQDILDATNTGAKIKTHLIDRAASADSGDKLNLDSLLLQMGRHVTKTVFDAWNKVFKVEITGRNVRFTSGKDSPSGRLYIQMHLEDTDGLYLLRERSLGFRWFFIFLMFTHYRGFREGASKNVLFLFDEPASNLHASAQSQLLNSFGVISEKCMIMYTTHSPYLINPQYLDGTYVIMNAGINYQSSDDGFTPKKTSITATKYRTFVTSHPHQTHYYQPILDLLDYSPSQLEHVPNVIMVEGKSDFYFAKYFSEIILADGIPRYFLPGTGAGTLGTPIQLYLAWARNFLILLDDDAEGRKQKIRYTESFGIICESRIHTLSSINKSWVGFEMEKLIADADKISIQQFAYPHSTSYNKTHFQRAIQEALMLKRKLVLSDETKENFTELFKFIDQKLLG
jgi:AAA ATPase domain